MYDAHNDLLTDLYFNLKPHNKYQNLESLIIQLQNVYRDRNIEGGIINFVFSNSDEMYEKFGIASDELKDAKKMFQESIEFLENLKFLEILDKNTKFLYSIEGCNYLNPEDLDELKKLGLASILPVSNDNNKYGSGYNGNDNQGLTEEGKQLIKTAINQKIMIDVSNCNEKTFNDILDIIEEEKEKGKEIFLIASHTNAKDLCQNKRNFSKEQLTRLKKNDGYIGINTNTNILCQEKTATTEEKEQALINQIDYMIKEIEFEDDKILIASDDMNYHPDPKYHNKELYPLKSIKFNLDHLLTKNYGNLFAKKVLEKNHQHLFSALAKHDIIYNSILSQKII